MDMQQMTMVIGFINFLLNWGLGFYIHITNKNKATNERIAKLEEDLASKFEGHVQRITKLETTASNAPSHADLAKMYESINNLAGTVNQLVGENRGQSDTLRLILNQITEKGMR